MNKAQREVVNQRLQELTEAAGGVLTPEAVVEDAKDPSSPLHAYFEWDQGKAAYAHWLSQARALITSVRVDFKVDKQTIRSVGYVRDPEAAPKEQGYVTVQSLRTEEDRARMTICDEFARVAVILQRARKLAKILGATEDVEKVYRSVMKLQEQYQQPAPTQQM